jgi:hypothetical protein
MRTANILDLAIIEMAKRRHPKTISPSEVLKWIYPHDWRAFIPEVQESMMWLFREGKIRVTQAGELADATHLPKGPVRISIKIEPEDDEITKN